MPGLANLVLIAMASEIYDPNEARRLRSHYYGFAEANAGSPHGSPDREGWIVALSRRCSAMIAASVAILHRL
jgi:hypothetical protein